MGTAAALVLLLSCASTGGFQSDTTTLILCAKRTSLGHRRRRLQQPHLSAVTSRSTFEEDVHTLASATLALLEEDMVRAAAPFGGLASSRGDVITRVFGEAGQGEKLSTESARALFEMLAVDLVKLLAESDRRPSARLHAQRLLDSPAQLNVTCTQIAAKLLAIADANGDGDIGRHELTNVFDAIRSESHPLDAVVGSLQLLPPHLRAPEPYRGEDWHASIPGDARVLKQWRAPDFDSSRVSIVGIGRSADASAYFLPELGIVMDAGLSVKSLEPKIVLLTHGHRDHTQALPSLARKAKFGGAKKSVARVVLPFEIEHLARHFVQSEALLNLGKDQPYSATDAALGELDFVPVREGDDVVLSKEIGVHVYRATHKPGVPAVAYGLYRRKKRLRRAFIGSSPEYIRDHRDEVVEHYKASFLFYSGDSSISMLHTHPNILSEYKYIIHECTFLAADPDDPALQATCEATGHTHYAQLFPLICDNPQTTFILVHFSTRYSRHDVLTFFDSNYGGIPHNVVLWI